MIPIYDSMSQYAVPAIKVRRVPPAGWRIATFNGTPFVLKLVQDGDISRWTPARTSPGWVGSHGSGVPRDRGRTPRRSEHTPLRVFERQQYRRCGTPPRSTRVTDARTWPGTKAVGRRPLSRAALAVRRVVAARVSQRGSEDFARSTRRASPSGPARSTGCSVRTAQASPPWSGSSPATTPRIPLSSLQSGAAPARLPLPPGRAASSGSHSCTRTWVSSRLSASPRICGLASWRPGATGGFPGVSSGTGPARHLPDSRSSYPGQPVARLRPVERALLAIVRAVEEMRSSSAERGVLVLDEPTVFLPEPERRRLLALVRGLSGEGASVLFVSHDLDEALEFADRITVLRDGRSIATVATEALDRRSLAELMTGRPLRGGDRASRAERICRRIGRWPRRRCCSQPLLRGSDREVLGLTGLLGSGFDEVLYLLFGARPSRWGLVLGGASYDTASLTPARAVRAGMALGPGGGPGTRRERRIASDRGQRCDAPCTRPLPHLAQLHSIASGCRDTAELLSRFGVRPNEPTLPFRALSGGNQQKALLAKALDTGPSLLLLAIR